MSISIILSFFRVILDELTLSSILCKFGLQIKLHDRSTWSIVTRKLAIIGSQDSVLALAQVCKILKIKKLKYWEYIIVSMERYLMVSKRKILVLFSQIALTKLIFEKKPHGF